MLTALPPNDVMQLFICVPWSMMIELLPMTEMAAAIDPLQFERVELNNVNVD
jgi:hypothetical protein